MTTTSEAPYLPPPSPSPPQPAATPRSARARTPSRQPVSPTKRNISATKSRSTPAKSPRKSPSKNFQSVKNVSFTPQRTKQPPRAWERRPATPYVPRDEKQKIWKRVPLGEISVDTNRPIGISRRQQEAGKDYARVVKKLKIGHNAGEGEVGEDKENLGSLNAVDTQVLSESDVKREMVRKSGGHNFVTMRVEEDEIQGSPKKKLRRPVSELNMHVENQEQRREDGMQDGIGNETESGLTFREEEYEFDACCGEEVEQESNIAEDKRQQMSGKVDQAEETLAQPSEAGCVSAEQSEMTQQMPANSPGSTLPALNGPLTTSTTVPSKPIATDMEANNATDSDAQVEVASREAEGSQQDAIRSDLIEVVDGAIEDQLQLPGSSVPADSNEQDKIVGNEEASAASSEDKQMGVDQDVSGDDMGSSSPPTILAENVTIDELAARDSPTRTRSKPITDDESDEQPEEQETPGLSAAHEALPRRISDDETAFLREFMSRTKATRAERVARDQENQHISHDEPTRGTFNQEQPTLGHQDDLPQVPTFEPAAQEDAPPISPLRRSKRAAVTSIPRPHGLPNSIQLKRANGNEFIFKASQNSSTANVAMTTRSNTKKNKGTALNVPIRLEQLLAEKAKGNVGDAEQTTDTAVEHDSTETSNDKASKKRKRDKLDTGSKPKKVLKWNDENLVSYQETAQAPEWDDIEDSSQGSSEEQRQEDEQSGQDKHVKLRLTVASDSNSEHEALAEDIKEEAKDLEAATQQKEQTVRRVRRGVAGSVNGTPAPKTRSRRIMAVDESAVAVKGPTEEGLSVEISSAASAALNALAAEELSRSSAPAGTVGATRKSRMPVPSTARRGAAASASARTAVSSLPTRASATPATTAASENLKTKDASKVKSVLEKDKEGEKGDLLGRRRLRVRS